MIPLLWRLELQANPITSHKHERNKRDQIFEMVEGKKEEDRNK